MTRDCAYPNDMICCLRDRDSVENVQRASHTGDSVERREVERPRDGVACSRTQGGAIRQDACNSAEERELAAETHVEASIRSQ